MKFQKFIQGIIRIEHPSDGKGIYRSSQYGIYRYYEKFEWLIWRHRIEFNGDLGFPTPDMEGFDWPTVVSGGYDGYPKLTADPSYFCAFRNMNVFTRWVKNGEAARLIECGFRIIQLDVDDVHVGKKQVMFKKKNIRRSIDITSRFQKPKRRRRSKATQ